MSVENEKFAVIALADGVSTCKKAGDGATVACDAIVKLMSRRGDFFMEYDPEKIPKMILDHILYEIKKVAGEKAEEYSSTVACVVADKERGKLFYFNLGDSMILAKEHGKIRMLAAPADSTAGCPVTTTANAELTAESGVRDLRNIESVAIFSDGAWDTFFERNSMKENVERMLDNSGYDAIAQFLEEQDTDDDYSFVSLQKGNTRRKKRD